MLHAGAATLSDGQVLSVDMSEYTYVHVCFVAGANRNSVSVPVSGANIYLTTQSGTISGYLATEGTGIKWHALVSGASALVTRVYGID